MIEIISAGIILGITLAFMIGPVFLLLLEISMTKGVKKALIFDVGVLLADSLFIALIAYGSRFLADITNVLWIFAVGGFLLISFGIYNIYNSKKKKKHLEEHTELPEFNATNTVYFAKGFFLNFLNAGVLAYWLTTTVTLRATLKGDENESMLMWAYFISTIAAYFITDLVKIFTAQRIKSRLTPEVLIKIEMVVGIVLIFFGVFLILRGYLHTRGIGF